MKSFREHLREEVVPTALVKDGSIDIDNPDVRASINMALAHVTGNSAVTPYIALNKISQALAQYHIILPKRVYLEGGKGIEVHELRQFGHKMGMTDSGEFINEVPGKYYLFIRYNMNEPPVATYAYPTMSGTFRVIAKIVDQVELDRLVSMAEIAIAEEAEIRQLAAKAMAPKEPMHDITSDEKKVGNKKAVAASEKKSLDEEELDEAKMTRKQKDMAVRRFMGADADKILAMGKKEREEKKSFASAKKEIKRLKEDNLNEVSKGAAIRAYGATQDPDDDGYRQKTGERLKGHIERKFGKKAGEHAERHAHAAHFGRSPTMMKADDKLPKKSPSSSMRTTKSGKLNKQDTKSLGSDIKRRLGSHTAPKHLPEEQIDELKKSTLASYIKKAHVSGLEAASQGEIAYASKDKAGLRAANKTGEKREQGIERAANKLSMKESRMPASVIAHKQKLASMSPEELKKKFAGKTEQELKSMARRHGYGKDSDVYSKHIKEEQLDEVGDTARGQKKLAKVHTRAVDRIMKAVPINKPSDVKTAKKYSDVQQMAWDRLKEEQIDEKLTKRMSVADVIHDFVHSKDPKFEGKSTKERQKMALGAYYGMHPEKSNKLEESKKKKILVTLKRDPRAKRGGGVMSIPKDQYDPKIHNLASE